MALPRSTRRWGLALAVALALVVAWVLRAERGPQGSTAPARAERAATAEPEPGPAPPPATPRDRDDEPPVAPRALEARPEPAAAPEPPEIVDRAALRFQVRWDAPGLCGPEHAGRAAGRPALLATFVPLAGAPTRILYDPSVRPVMLDILRESVPLAAGRVGLRGFDPPPFPTVYVYRDVKQMLSVSCANQSATGYYDGAIHLSGDARQTGIDFQQTLIHEYVHHVLRSLGVALPTWLHEGLAMEVAGESWYLDPDLGLLPWLRNRHLPFEALAGGFPHAADERFALAAYCQSRAMVQFLTERRGPGVIPPLVGELAANRVDPADAFSWAAGLSGGDLERAWMEYVAGWADRPTLLPRQLGH